MSIERVVAVLTPLFAAASAWLTGVIAGNFPGLPTIPPTDLTALEIAGFTAATGAALTWLHGRQKYVTLTNDAKKSVEDALQKVRAEVAASPQASLAIADIEHLLKAHEGSIENSITAKLPASVAAAVQALFSQVAPQQPTPPQVAAIIPVTPVPPPV